jgi:hypothetical protein
MTVQELIKVLQDHHPDAEVFIGTQPTYPHEYHVEGIVQRASFADDDDNGEPEDVLLLEGEWFQYGNGDAWEHC